MLGVATEGEVCTCGVGAGAGCWPGWLWNASLWRYSVPHVGHVPAASPPLPAQLFGQM